MLRYHFHVCNGSGFTRDDTGQVLADLDEAKQVAVRGAREMMAGDIHDGELDLSAYIQVEDEHGELLFTVRFADAVSFVRRHDDK